MLVKSTVASPLVANVIVRPSSNSWRNAGGAFSNQLGNTRDFVGGSWQSDDNVIGEIDEIIIDAESMGRGGVVTLAFPGLDVADIIPDFATRQVFTYTVPRGAGTISLTTGSETGVFRIYDVYGRKLAG